MDKAPCLQETNEDNSGQAVELNKAVDIFPFMCGICFEKFKCVRLFFDHFDVHGRYDIRKQLPVQYSHSGLINDKDHLQSVTNEEQLQSVQSITNEEHLQSVQSITNEEHLHNVKSVTNEEHLQSTQSITNDRKLQKTHCLTNGENLQHTDSVTIKDYLQSSHPIKEADIPSNSDTQSEINSGHINTCNFHCSKCGNRFPGACKLQKHFIVYNSEKNVQPNDRQLIKKTNEFNSDFCTVEGSCTSLSHPVKNVQNMEVDKETQAIDRDVDKEMQAIIDRDVDKEMQAIIDRDVDKEMQAIDRDVDKETQAIIDRDVDKEMQAIDRNVDKEMQAIIDRDVDKEMQAIDRDVDKEMQAIDRDVDKEMQAIDRDVDKEMQAIDNTESDQVLQFKRNSDVSGLGDTFSEKTLTGAVPNETIVSNGNKNEVANIANPHSEDHYSHLVEKVDDLIGHDVKKDAFDVNGMEDFNEKCSEATGTCKIETESLHHCLTSSEGCDESLNVQTHESSEENGGKGRKQSNDDIDDVDYVEETDPSLKKRKIKKEQRNSRMLMDEKIPCDVCGVLSLKKNLPRHTLSHNSVKPYQCEHCDKLFKTKDQLYGHKLHHKTNKDFICDHCGKSFNNGPNLRQHMKIHTRGRTLKCPVCPKTFRSNYILKDHINRHSDNKPYICEHCGKSFRTGNEVHRHLRVHSDERPHACCQCEKSFKSRSNLLKHSKTHK